MPNQRWSCPFAVIGRCVRYSRFPVSRSCWQIRLTEPRDAAVQRPKVLSIISTFRLCILIPTLRPSSHLFFLNLSDVALYLQGTFAMRFHLVAAISAALCALSTAAPRADPKECEGTQRCLRYSTALHIPRGRARYGQLTKHVCRTATVRVLCTLTLRSGASCRSPRARFCFTAADVFTLAVGGASPVETSEDHQSKLQGCSLSHWPSIRRKASPRPDQRIFLQPSM